MKEIQPVILCGGSGTRLWPLSRKSLPKQFVPLIGEKSLLQITFERVAEFAETRPIWTVTGEEHRFLVKDAAEAAKILNRSILEPIGRNTAAAMAVAALNAPPTELLLYLPADHHVPDTRLFMQTIKSGLDAAIQGAFVTFGITPDQAHTGYGYIKARESSDVAKPVLQFTEKPDYETALNYLSSKNYFWNSGIFLVRADTVIKSLSKYAPDILESTRQAVKKQETQQDFIFLDKDAFSTCRIESIDYAVLEKHPNVIMIPFQGQWSDVGSWNAVAKLIETDKFNNRVVGKGLTHQADSTYVHAPYRPVVALGTDELLIVDTKDAVLVAATSHAEKVKDLVSDLQDQNIIQATEHRHAKRPWGEYDSIDEGDRFKVKRIKVKPGASLSLQLHNHRAEHWIVVKGTAKVTCEEKVFLLSENESTYIPKRSKHRLENPGNVPLEIIEVQSGSYLGEDDIERFDDHYGRAPK